MWPDSANSMAQLDTRVLPEINEVFDIPATVADRMLFYSRVRLRDKDRLARSCGRGTTSATPHGQSGIGGGKNKKQLSQAPKKAGRRGRGATSTAAAESMKGKGKGKGKGGSGGGGGGGGSVGAGGGGMSTSASAPALLRQHAELGPASEEEQRAQEALASTVQETNSATRAVGGVLAMIGTVDRVFVRGACAALVWFGLGWVGLDWDGGSGGGMCGVGVFIFWCSIVGSPTRVFGCCMCAFLTWHAHRLHRQVMLHLHHAFGPVWPVCHHTTAVQTAAHGTHASLHVMCVACLHPLSARQQLTHESMVRNDVPPRFSPPHTYTRVPLP